MIELWVVGLTLPVSNFLVLVVFLQSRNEERSASIRIHLHIPVLRVSPAILCPDTKGHARVGSLAPHVVTSLVEHGCLPGLDLALQQGHQAPALSAYLYLGRR